MFPWASGQTNDSTGPTSARKDDAPAPAIYLASMIRTAPLEDGQSRPATRPRKLLTPKHGFLALFVLYVIDLVWKLASYKQTFRLVPLWGVALGLVVRFAFMGLLLYLYVRCSRADTAKRR